MRGSWGGPSRPHTPPAPPEIREGPEEPSVRSPPGVPPARWLAPEATPPRPRSRRPVLRGASPRVQLASPRARPGLRPTAFPLGPRLGVPPDPLLHGVASVLWAQAGRLRHRSQRLGSDHVGEGTARREPEEGPTRPGVGGPGGREARAVGSSRQAGGGGRLAAGGRDT